MQNLTTRLMECCKLVSGDVASVHVVEGDDYFRLEATMDRSSAENLKWEDLERLASFVAPDLQKTYLDVSALSSHEILLAEQSWKTDLKKYLDDARLLEEPWTARIAVTLDKKAIVRETRLDTGRFHVVPTFLFSTLLNMRRLPLRDQLHALFPDRQRKTVFLMFEAEIFWDGPFLCLTDWARLKSLSYSDTSFTEATKRVEMIQQECSWQGVERIFLPEFLVFTQTAGNPHELAEWLRSLKGALGLFAIANVTELASKKAQLTFWGAGKRQITLNGAGPLNNNTAERCDALYSWIYREVPHPNAALRISRNLVAQQLGPDPEKNVSVLEVRLADVLASAKANYAAFVQEKLKDFFELGKEISSYTNTAADYLNKTLGELNESLRKSVFTTLGVVGGALLSTAAVQLNPMTYTFVLVGYGLFLFFFNVYYLPRVATTEFSEHLRRFREHTQPYLEFLNPSQRREVLEEVPLQHGKKFARTRRLVRALNCALAGLVFCLSGYDVPRVAKSFEFVPTWALGRAINWLFKFVAHYS